MQAIVRSGMASRSRMWIRNANAGGEPVPPNRLQAVSYKSTAYGELAEAVVTPEAGIESLAFGASLAMTTQWIGSP